MLNGFALDMRQSFPNETGFSFTNVKYMKQWYSFYFERIRKGQRVIGQIANKFASKKAGKSQRVIGQLEMPKAFGKIPWGQHIDIVSRCESIDEALFYVKNVVDNGWSRPVLNANIVKASRTSVTN